MQCRRVHTVRPMPKIMPKAHVKTERVVVRANKKQVRHYEAIAKESGIELSALVRLLLVREGRRLGVVPS